MRRRRIIVFDFVLAILNLAFVLNRLPWLALLTAAAPAASFAYDRVLEQQTV